MKEFIENFLFTTEGMRIWNTTFTVTPVPGQETTFMCQTFEFPDATSDYHIVAYQPHIDNEYVLHHMLMYACPDDVGMFRNNSRIKCIKLLFLVSIRYVFFLFSVISEILSEPIDCGMGSLGCSEMIFVWSVGLGGHCLNDEVGIRMGLNGYKKVVVEVSI